MIEQHVFSTGALRIGAVGATLTDDANGVGNIEDVSVEIKYQKKEMREPAQVSMYPVDVAHYQGDVQIKVTSGDFNRALIALISGAVSSNSGNTLTLTKTSKPGRFRLEFDGIDTNGKAVKLVLFNGYSDDLTLGFKIDDYVKPGFTAIGLADASDNVLTMDFAQ